MSTKKEVIQKTQERLFNEAYNTYATDYNDTKTHKINKVASYITILRRLEHLLDVSFSLTPPAQPSIESITSKYHEILEDEYVVAELISRWIEKEYPETNTFSDYELDTIISTAKNLTPKLSLHVHRRSLNLLTVKIISESYPEKVSSYDDLSSHDKQVLHGAAREKKLKKEEREREHWKPIVEAVKEVIGERPLADFVTDSGDANSSLYTFVYAKYPNLPIGTLKKWLNESIKNGRLVEDLKKLAKA